MPSRFVITNVEGSSIAQVGGRKIVGTRTARTPISKWLSLVATGNERSDCDPRSGRTVSRAEVRALVTPTVAQGLNFDYKLAAQGGHFRTAVAGCLGSNLIGLSGNDTDAVAALKMRGEIAFEARDDQPLLLRWIGMPTAGAIYRLLTKAGELVFSGVMSGSNVTNIRLPTSGAYRLETVIKRQLAHNGASAAPVETTSAQITLAPTK